MMKKLCPKTCGCCVETDSSSCKNPFISDPESWDCACHEIMVKKCEGKDFASCYREQLCQSRRVCDSWKRQVCNGKGRRAGRGRRRTGKAAARHGWAVATPTPTESPQ